MRISIGERMSAPTQQKVGNTKTGTLYSTPKKVKGQMSKVLRHIEQKKKDNLI